MPRILLCEDEPILARNIMRALARGDVEVDHVGSARAMAHALRLRRFDLVIADISLGDGDGLTTLSDATEQLRNTPVIVMTGQDSVMNRSRAEGLAVSAFLAKPFALSRLRELVAALTRGRVEGACPKGTSVVMYSHDTIGLGHMRRNSAIAKTLVTLVPDASVLMLVGCPAGMVFESVPGIDYVKLPSLAKLGRGAFAAGSLRLEIEAIKRLRRGVIEGVLSNFRPDLLLVDHEPGGVMGELEPALRRIRAEGGTRTVLGLRDILDAPDRVAHSWAANGTDRMVRDLYDQVLVYGDAGFFDSKAAYDLPAQTRTCGVVTGRQFGPARSHNPKRPRHVLVSGGGGRDAYPLINAAISALSVLPKSKRPAMTIVTGPLMDAELQTDTATRAVPLGIEVKTHVSDLTVEMARSDLLVTMTGYNSINEALAMGCPVVTVPRLGPSAEQRLRAERLDALGLARVLNRETLTPDALARVLTAPLPNVPPRPLDMDGAEQAARILQTLIETQVTEQEAIHAADS
jgi:predicted glycosyltransferase